MRSPRVCHADLELKGEEHVSSDGSIMEVVSVEHLDVVHSSPFAKVSFNVPRAVEAQVLGGKPESEVAC